MEYRARLTRDGEHWLASFPDCSGCQTFGRSRGEALAAAQEALEGWLEAHLVSGRVPPAPKAQRGTAVRVGARLSTALQLRWWRHEHQLTQAQTAKRASVSQQQIAKLENPDANPTLATLEKVAAALGIRVDVTLSAA